MGESPPPLKQATPPQKILAPLAQQLPPINHSHSPPPPQKKTLKETLVNLTIDFYSGPTNIASICQMFSHPYLHEE